MISNNVEINHYNFENNLSENLINNDFAKDLWPLVYILSDGKTKTSFEETNWKR